MDSAKNGSWIIQFKKFGMVRVNHGHVYVHPRILREKTEILQRKVNKTTAINKRELIYLIHLIFTCSQLRY